MSQNKNEFLWDLLKMNPIQDALITEYNDMLANIQTKFNETIFNLNILSGSGVYHPNEGSSSLFCIRNIPQLQGRVLDMGCGCGIIGLHLKNRNKEINLTLTDVDPKALKLSTENAKNNHLEAHILKSNVFRALKVEDKFDSIIFNVPLFNKKFLTSNNNNLNNPEDIHAEIPLADFGMVILNEFFANYHHYLKENGKCYITISNISGVDTVSKFQANEHCEIIALEYKSSSNVVFALIEISN